MCPVESGGRPARAEPAQGTECRANASAEHVGCLEQKHTWHRAAHCRPPRPGSGGVTRATPDASGGALARHSSAYMPTMGLTAADGEDRPEVPPGPS